MRALVCFHDKESHHWANRWLKPGFWHVFVCVCDCPEIEPLSNGGHASAHWIRIDAQDGKPAFEVVAPSTFDLATLYASEGLTVLEIESEGRRPLWPWMCANCVGVAKMVLGIRAWWVLTPWQLYNHVLRLQAIERAFDRMEAA